MISTRFLLVAAAALAVTTVVSTPVHAQVSVVGMSIQEREAPAGSEYTGSVAVRNDTPLSQQVRLYLTDYRFTAGGVSEFAKPGSSSRSNAPWITLGAQVVVLAPYQTSAISYRVNVPAGGNEVIGSYWSTLMLEAEQARRSTRPGASVDVQAIVRQGVQVVTHVGAGGAAAISFTNVRVVPGATGPALEFDTENVGIRARRLSLSVDLYSEDGKFVGRYSKVRGLVYPGCSIRQSFAVGALAKGNYLAFIVADAGEDDLFAGNFKVKL